MASHRLLRAHRRKNMARRWNCPGNLGKYIIRDSFSKERMVYIPAEKSADGIARVVYSSKDDRTKKTFDVLDWLACLVAHVPNKYEQLVRYVGYYSNKSMGMRKKADNDHVIVSIAPGEMSSKEFRRNWARLIKKIYEIDPLCCPNCKETMRIISLIESGPIYMKERYVDLLFHGLLCPAGQWMLLKRF